MPDTDPPSSNAGCLEILVLTILLAAFVVILVRLW